MRRWRIAARGLSLWSADDWTLPLEVYAQTAGEALGYAWRLWPEALEVKAEPVGEEIARPADRDLWEVLSPGE